MNQEMLEKELRVDESLELKPYKDSVGKLSIGIGRNLDDVGISEDEAYYLLRNDIAKAYDQCTTKFAPWFYNLSDARQRVLVNMCFNMGISKLLEFKNTLRAVADGKYEEASKHMLDSLWANQVGDRAVRLAEMMKNG